MVLPAWREARRVCEAAVAGRRQELTDVDVVGRAPCEALAAAHALRATQRASTAAAIS